MSVDNSLAVGDARLGKAPPSFQNLALTVMLGLVAWLTFAQTRALQDARKLVDEATAAAERADRICRQSAMITISVRELKEEFVRQRPEKPRQEEPPRDGSFAMNELPGEGD
jgi:hypothetical protein